jgi:hypothetical protein
MERTDKLKEMYHILAGRADGEWSGTEIYVKTLTPPRQNCYTSRAQDHMLYHEQ